MFAAKCKSDSHECSRIGTAARSVVGGTLAAIIGMALVIAVGILDWDAVVGMRGPLVAAGGGFVAAGFLCGFGHQLARRLAGGLGAAVAGFFVIAAAEMSPPGSVEWAVNGALVGALFGIPVASAVALTIEAVVVVLRRHQ